MADFCKQCSIREFGEDFRDLAGICQPGALAWVICEGCKDHVRWPYILVNHEGERRKEIEEATAKAWGKNEGPNKYETNHD